MALVRLKLAIIAFSFCFITKALADNPTYFETSNGWQISGPNFDTKKLCAASTSISGLKLTVRLIRVEEESWIQLEVEKRPHQEAVGPLSVRFDDREIDLSPKNYSLEEDSLSMLLPERSVSTHELGLSQRIEVALEPYLSVNLDTPTYAMYLLEDCNSRQTEKSVSLASVAMLREVFPMQLSELQREVDKSVEDAPRSAPQITPNLPNNFESFVRAFSLADDDEIRFLTVKKAQDIYVDWAEAGWTGGENFIVGIAFSFQGSPVEIRNAWAEERVAYCRDNNGRSSKFDFGRRTAKQFKGHVSFHLCQTDSRLHRLELFVTNDEERFAILEAIEVPQRMLKDIKEWLLEQSK